MKEQTPITPDKNLIYSKIGGCLRNQESEYVVRVVADLMEQYAQAKVLEALEREVPKTYRVCQKKCTKEFLNIEVDENLFKDNGFKYYETEVKPKYER